MKHDDIPTTFGTPDAAPTHGSTPTTALPAHASFPTTAGPAHVGTETTATPAHAHMATTAAPAASAPGAPPATARSRHASYDAGERIEVGTHRLVIERLLFVGGQAELYLVRGGPAPVSVLKLYTHGARPKADVLARWRQLPPTAVIALLDADPHAEPRAWELLAYAEGGTLAGPSDTPPQPMRDAARLRHVTLQAADALHALHTIGSAVHRDVSPDNFLWLDARQTQLVLSDLGSSSIMSDGAARSVTIRGKLPFMAPEELLPMGDGVVVGEGADFYALGIMVLTLWAGHHPFVGREADQIALKSRGAVPIPDDLPADLRSLVEALLLPANLRLTYDGIRRWAAGEAIPRTTAVRSVSYPRLTVRPAQGAPYDVETPAALARFLRDEPTAGERFLYAWNMREWASSDAGLVADLTDIVENEFPKNRAAGRVKAAYLLDASLPFVTPDGVECRDYAALSAWLEGDPSRPAGLRDAAHPLWLYLTTRPENDLREAMAEIHEDVRAGKPEATALIRHYLMQFAIAGSWRDGDATVVADLDTFVARLDTRSDVIFQKLLDPADPLLLWLETQRPGTAARGGRLRALPPAVRRRVGVLDWIGCVLNDAPTVPGAPLVTATDSWREELWPPTMRAPLEQVAVFVDAWWRVVEGERFETAALAWLASRPSSGARRQVACALVAGDWESTLQPLSAVLSTALAALPSYSGDPADGVVLDACVAAYTKRLTAIRDGAATEQCAAVQLEGAVAFATAAAQARSSAPAWWDALLARLGDSIAAVVRDAFAANRGAPNVLAELIVRRNDLSMALAVFRLPVVARWRKEDARQEVLGRELAAAEATARDARVKAIADKAVSLRGTPHVQTLADVAKGLSFTEQRWISRANVLFLLVAGMGLLSAIPFDPSTGRMELPTGILASLLTGYAAWRLTHRRGVAIVALLLGSTLLSLTIPVWRVAFSRLVIGAIVCAALGLALLIRQRHVRNVERTAQLQQQQMPDDLAASVRKACADVEALSIQALHERWLMMHATLALAADPDKVQLADVPGAAAAAA